MNTALPSAWSSRLHAALRFGSLKLRLALVGCLLIGASVALTVGLVLREVGERTEQVAIDMSLAQARKLARLMSARIVGLQIALRNVADHLPLEHLDDRAALLAHLQGESALATLLDSNFIAKASGEIVAWRDAQGLRDPKLNIGDRAYFQLTLRQGRPIVSEPILGRISGQPVVMLTMPVRDAGGKLVAVVGGSVRLASRGLMPEITEADDDEAASTVVTDAQGRIISHAERRWLMRDATAEPALAVAVAQWEQQGRPIEPSGFAGRMGERIVAMAGVPDAEWMVFRSAPVDLLLGGLNAGRQRALVIGSAVAVGGGAVLLLATFLMLVPLRRLEQRARRMLDDDLADDEAWPRAGGEIGRLAHALQHAMRERASAAASNRELVDKMRAVMAHAPIGIAITRGQSFDLVSEAFSRQLGYASVELEGQPARLLYESDAFYEALGTKVGTAFGAGLAFDEELHFVRRDASRFWGRLQGAPVRWGDPSAGTIWVLEDVSRARSEREALSWTSSHDPLTELANRREFERLLAERIASPAGSEPVCALFIDLDRFKAVNDSAGHAAGDRMLVEVGRLLAEQVRGSDTVARLGGDEFGVLLASCDRAGAMQIAEKMRAAVDAYRLHWGERVLLVGVSIGVVQLDASLPDPASVMAAADAACYEAKRHGRNAVRGHAAGLRLVSG